MAAYEVELELEADMWVRWADLGVVREEFWGLIDEWQEAFDADYRLCWTGSSAFRKRIAPDYKANRSSRPKPIGYKALKNELLTYPKTYGHDEIEADDWLGILAGACRKAGEMAIVVSGDKDLDQVPGRHYWPWGVKKKESEGLGVLEWDNELLPIEDRKAIQWTVGQDYSEKHFYQQVLIGDSTDNIPGCPGVGAVGATKIVSKFDTAEPVECWQEIVWAYEKAFTKKGDVRKPEVVALQQAQLVRILRHGEYNAETRTVDLWTPPTLKS